MHPRLRPTHASTRTDQTATWVGIVKHRRRPSKYFKTCPTWFANRFQIQTTENIKQKHVLWTLSALVLFFWLSNVCDRVDSSDLGNTIWDGSWRNSQYCATGARTKRTAPSQIESKFQLRNICSKWCCEHVGAKSAAEKNLHGRLNAEIAKLHKLQWKFCSKRWCNHIGVKSTAEKKTSGLPKRKNTETAKLHKPQWKFRLSIIHTTCAVPENHIHSCKRPAPVSCAHWCQEW